MSRPAPWDCCYSSVQPLRRAPGHLQPAQPFRSPERPLRLLLAFGQSVPLPPTATLPARLSGSPDQPGRLPAGLSQPARLPLPPGRPVRLPTAGTIHRARRNPVCLWQWLVTGGLLWAVLLRPATVPLRAEEVPRSPSACPTDAVAEASAVLAAEANPAAGLSEKPGTSSPPPEKPKPSSFLAETKPTTFPSAQPNGPDAGPGAEHLHPTNGQMYKLVLWDGRTMPAVLESASEESIRFRTPDGKSISVLPEELVRWGSPRQVQRGPVVLLADGSLLVGQVPRLAAMLLEIEPDLLDPRGQQACRLPVGQVAGVVFRLPTELEERDRLLDRLVGQVPEEDLLLLLNGDQLQGRLEAIEDQTVRLAGPLGPMPVEVARIRAVQFRRLPRTAPGPEAVRIWVGLQDGSLLLADRLLLQESKAILHLTGNLSLQTDRENLVFLQPIGGRVLYLSDLKPKQYLFEPFFQMHWPWQADRSVTGTWLRVQGRRYLKGLGVHSKATLKYDLAGRYRWLEAELALDDTAKGRGCVVFRILADGKPLYQSPPISGGDPPQPIRLEVAGVRELELVVDYGPWGDMLDRANWLDARLIPDSPAAQPPSKAR